MNRKKLQTLCFDDLLDDINPPTLKKNLNKVLHFLEDDSPDVCFPYLSEQFEEIIIRIGQDVGVLNTTKLNDSYRDVCNKIINIVKWNKSLYELTSFYADRRVTKTDKGLRRTLVLKKDYYNNNGPVVAPGSDTLSDSNESTGNIFLDKIDGLTKDQPTESPSIISDIDTGSDLVLNKENHSSVELTETTLSTANSDTDKCSENYLELIKENNCKDEPIESNVYSSMESLATSQASSCEHPNDLLQRSNTLSPSSKYKLKCLQKALAFVKNKAIEKIEYPNLNLEQFEFLDRLFKNVLVYAAYESDFGNRLFYVALYEAIKIFSLKYEFSVKVLDSDNTKTLVFEKTLKPKSAMDNTDNNTEKKRTMHPRIQPPEDTTNIPKTKENSLPSYTIAQSLYLRASDSTIPEPRLTRKQQKKKIRIQEAVQSLPRSFVITTLNRIIEFLSVEKEGNLICVPYNESELRFYRNVIIWANTPNRNFEPEYDALFDKIHTLLFKMVCKVPAGKNNKVNMQSGLKEVTYKKKPRLPPSEQPAKAKKIKKMHRLDSDASDRSAGCGKSLSKKMKYEDLGMEEQASRITNWRLRPEENTDSEMCAGDFNKSRQLAQRERDIQDRRVYSKDMHTRRKEQLIEAMSVPVQSDKAMRMMRGMGWSGGALGARGTGITEPIMPALNVRAGAGFGHDKNATNSPKIVINTNKLSNATNPNWFTDTNWAETETVNQTSKPDYVVQTTKALLESKISFDNFDANPKMPNVEKDTKPKIPKVENWDTRPKMPNVENWNTRPKMPNVENWDTRPKMPNVENLITTPIMPNVENWTTKPKMPKVENWNTRPKMPNVENWDTSQTYIGNEQEFRLDILKSVIELLTTDATSKLIKYTFLTKRDRRSAKNSINNMAVRNKSKLSLLEVTLFDQIEGFYDRLPGVVITSTLVNGCKEILLKKVELFTKRELEEFTKNDQYIQEVINKSVLFLLHSVAPIIPVKKYTQMKFKVYILLKIFLFVKSDDKKIRVELDQILSQNKMRYIVSATEAVNARIRYGACQAEIALSLEINKHVGDNFLDVEFNHQFMSFTLTKHTEKPTPCVLDTNTSVYSFVSDNSQEANRSKDFDLVNNNKIERNSVEIAKITNYVEGVNLSEKEYMKTSVKKEPEINDKHENVETVAVDYEILIDSQEFVVNDTNQETDKPEIIEIIDDETIIEQLDEAIDDLGKSYLKSAHNDQETLKQPEKSYEAFVEIERNEKDCLIDITGEGAHDKNSFENDSAYKVDWSKEDDVVEIHSEDIVMEESSGPEDISMTDDDVLNILPTTDEEGVMETLETDSDTNLSKNLVLSVFQCDKRSFSSVKNVSYEVEANKKVENKKGDVFKGDCQIKNVYFVPKNFPLQLIPKEKAKEIQTVILNALVTTKELPLIKCHGVQNGALIYSCHNKKTFDWLKKITCVVSDIKMMPKEVNKMALKLYTLIEFDVDYLFSMMELYNKGLSTKEWVVEKTEIHSDYVIFLVKMDSFSVNYVHACNLTLFAGVDKVEFSIVWD